MTYYFRKLTCALALLIAANLCFQNQTAFALGTSTADLGLALSIDAISIGGIALDLGDDPSVGGVDITAFGADFSGVTFEDGAGFADAGSTTDLGPDFLLVGDFIEQIVSASAFVPSEVGEAEGRIGTVLTRESTISLDFLNSTGAVVDITIGYDTTFLASAEADGEFSDAFADGAVELVYIDQNDVVTELSNLTGAADALGQTLDEDLGFGTFQIQLQPGGFGTLEGSLTAFATASSLIPEPTSIFILFQALTATLLLRRSRTSDRS